MLVIVSACTACFIHAQSIFRDTPELADLDRRVGELYQNGSYSEAISFAIQSLDLSKKTLGPEHPDTATRATNLAGLYVHTGDYAKAEPLLQRSLDICERTLGPANVLTAISANNLAGLYAQRGQSAKAESLLQRSLDDFEKAVGPEHPDILPILGSLAGFYNQRDNYAKAEPLCLRAVKICEKALGPEDANTAGSLSNLAGIYVSMGDYARAAPLLQRSLRILEQALGPEHPGTAVSLNNLAHLYNSMGDYTKAETLAQRSVAISEKTSGPEHPKTAESLNNLAMTYLGTGDYEKAKLIYQRMLSIFETALGREDPMISLTLGNLAALHSKLGEYATAIPLYQRALKIIEMSLGPNNPTVGATLGELAEAYSNMGDYAAAEPLSRRALEICQTMLGPEHPVTARMLRDRAMLKMARVEQRAEIVALVKKASSAEESYLSRMLSFTSEEQRLAFQKTTRPYDLPGTLGTAQDLATIVLRQKAVVLDSLLEDRVVAQASGDPEKRAIVDELQGAKQQLTKLVMEVPRDVSELARQTRRIEKETLFAKVEQLEGDLARQVAGLGRARRALSITVRHLQATLPQQTALIEFLRYSHYLGKDQWEPRYGAVIICRNVKPKWVPLGSAIALEKTIALYQKSARGLTDEPTLHQTLRDLDTQAWAPLEKSLPKGTRRIVLSPDGQLNFISFATLLGAGDRFVAEKYSVSYVASGRDLLKATSPSSNPTTLVYANPDFGGKAVARNEARSITTVLRSAEIRDLGSISLPPLPGTALEAAALEARAGKSARVFLGADATEAELRRADSPRVLHLATHGFFLPEWDLGEAGKPSRGINDVPKGRLVNPMHRSGLALAGAQSTLEDWKRGEMPATENDGILTAEEVGGLKLENTWLVVLSACDTGSGEARAGEGVMGLRRGFTQAGAQNLLMTLWPISDQTTVEIMLNFYATAEKSGSATQALADVQRHWLVRLRKERGLQAAVQLAGAFIMSSQGPP